MKTINVPYIESVEAMDFDRMQEVMEEHAAKAFISENNWPDAFPYTPLAAASVARSKTHLCILFNVKGFDLRAVAMEDQGNSWEDSCCEFFVSHPSDGTYYNFELTCIGTLLASKRTDREHAEFLPKEQMQRIIRHSSLEKKPYDISDRIFSWSTAMCIPFEIFGADSENLPDSLRVNFFKCGDLTSHVHFLSWNPIESPSPDFHKPEFFGEIKFSK